MKDLQIFNNPEFGEIQGAEIDTIPCLAATETARMLGYVNPQEAIRTHCKGVREILTPTAGGKQKKKFIPEGDLYRLIVRSQLPAAEKFERWVFDEVLPTIRKTGKYEMPKQKTPSLGEVNSAARIINQAYKEAGVNPQFRAVAVQRLYATVGVEIPLENVTVEKRLFDATAIAKLLGINSKSGNPHAQAVGAIIAKLPIEKGERELVPFQRDGNGHSGTNWQYTEVVIEKIKVWLNQFNFPSVIVHKDKSYQVIYENQQSAQCYEDE